MSTIKTNPAVAGKVTSAAQTNATYSAVAAATAFLTDINEQTEWITFGHLDVAIHESLFTTDLGTYCNSEDTYTLTSESYTLINLGGASPVEITYFPVLAYGTANALLRVHADINLHDYSDEFEIQPLMQNDEDVFYLQLYYEDGNNVYHEVECEWGYSITNYTQADIVNVAFPTTFKDFSTRVIDWCESHNRRRLRCSVTGFIPFVASGIRTIELRGRLVDNTILPSVEFKEATMTAVMVRN